MQPFINFMTEPGTMVRRAMVQYALKNSNIYFFKILLTNSKEYFKRIKN